MITLSQRSNVETLTIAFFLLFFGYFAVITAHGALGAVRIGLFHLRARWMRDRARATAAQIAALGDPAPGPAAAFDRAVELEGRPGEPWEIELRDEHGSMGRLRVSGVRVEHLDAYRGGSNSLLGYLEATLSDVRLHLPDLRALPPTVSFVRRSRQICSGGGQSVRA